MRLAAVVGGRGMLGVDLVGAAPPPGWRAVGLDLPAIDITDPQSVAAALPNETDVVINCAAFTRVDDAESQARAAFAVNADGAGHLARACAERGIRLLHLSTDYVFPGAARHAVNEDEAVGPVNIYGKSKLAGEHQVSEAGGEHLIVRVQSLFGRHGPSFVAAISRKLTEGSGELRVVDDQVSSPTYTRHLADALWRLAVANYTGIVHVRAAGHCSWYEFAVAIAARMCPGAKIQPVPTSAYPTPARRPAYSVLDTRRFESWLGRPLPTWQEGLDAYLTEIQRGD